ISTRISDILEEYELSGLDDLAQALFVRSEDAIRRMISDIPEGTYSSTMLTDGFGENFTYSVMLTVRGGEIFCDFSGTSPQQPRGISCVLSYTTAMTLYAIKSLLLPDLPNNHGLFVPITVTAPEGSILNPKYPAPVGG